VGLGFTPRIEPASTCRTDRAGGLHDVSASEGEERVGLVPSPDLWAGRITYLVRFVKVQRHAAASGLQNSVAAAGLNQAILQITEQILAALA
jgi:hypothetical protein